MREVAKAVRAIGHCAYERPEALDFQAVWPDRLVSEIGYTGDAASTKNHKLPVFKNAVPEIARK
ncbi:hypothetical protein [Mesorhizobium argentiipisi]|uniref:Uncharacterized protein n=1 Tax=Mesorhizobium argentiipisi TaxID=3015175 RepID=A0ABU8KHL0_9HYPH